MPEIIEVFKDTPIPNTLVIAGLFFLLLALAGGISGRIEIPRRRQKWAGGIGTLLLLLGVALHVLISFPTVSTPAESSIREVDTSASTRSSPSAVSSPVTTLSPSATSSIRPAQDGEILILIATFHYTDLNTEPHYKICRAIQRAIDEHRLTNLRVEVEPTMLKADDRLEAEALGEQYKASMIIWGEDTRVQVIVNLLNLAQESHAEISANLSQLEDYAHYITEGLPTQLTFLALLATGQTLDKEGKYTDAFDPLQAAIASWSPEVGSDGLVNAYFILGRLYQRLSDYDRAIDSYTQAIAVEPKTAEAYNNRGVIYLNLGDLDNAIADFDRAIEHKPGDASPYNNRGVAYMKKEDYEQATVSLEEAISLDPNDAVAHNNLAYCLAYHMDTEYDLALTHALLSVELDKDQAYNHDTLALVYYKLGRYYDALDHYDIALDVDPDQVPTYMGRADVFFALRQYDGAIEDYKKFLELSDDPELRKQAEEKLEALGAN